MLVKLVVPNQNTSLFITGILRRRAGESGKLYVGPLGQSFKLLDMRKDPHAQALSYSLQCRRGLA